MGRSPEVTRQLEQMREDLLIRALIQDYLANIDPVTDEDVNREYQRVHGAGGSDKEYRARHILVEKEEEANAILASLKKGEKFEELAKKLSKDPGSGANGGDLDWAVPASYVAEFSQAMIKLEKGQTSTEPVKSQFGYHIIRVDDVREAKLPAIDELKPQIAQQLGQQKLAKFQEDLRKAATIK